MRSIGTLGAVVIAAWALYFNYRALGVNAKALEAGQRPWVLFDYGGGHSVDAKALRVRVKNFGRTPAFQISSGLRVAQELAALAPDPVILMHIAPAPGRPMLPPDQTTTVSLPLDIEGQPIDVTRIWFGLIQLAWRDQFGNEGTADICVQVDPNAVVAEDRVLNCWEFNSAEYWYLHKTYTGQVYYELEPAPIRYGALESEEPEPSAPSGAPF
jgi:hypothetical protein